VVEKRTKPQIQRLSQILPSVKSGDFGLVAALLEHPAWGELEAAFWNVSHPMPASARAAYTEYIMSAQLLWQRVGAGSIRPLSVFRPTLSSPVSLEAALRILAKIYAGCNLGYSAPPTGFWRSLYAITGYVLAHERDEKRGDTNALKNLCMQLWLMAWLNPLSLTAGRLPIAVRLVGRLSTTCTYSMVPPTHSGSGLAAADLMDDRPPVPFSRISTEWAPQLPVYINAQDAAFLMQEIRSNPNGDGVQRDLYSSLLATGEAVGLTKQEVNDFVKRALREFGHSHTRTIPRFQAQGAVECVIGFVSCWDALAQQQDHDGPAEAPEDVCLKAAVLNHSEGGFLLQFELDEPQLRTSALVVLRGNQTEPWSLGVVRWLQDNGCEILVGCEVISNFSEARLAKLSTSSQQFPVIVCENEAQTQAFTPLGTAEPTTIIETEFDSDLWVLSAVQEAGDQWEMRTMLDSVARAL
jgi:hypothetical protein